jgi:hypothetical protein
MAVSAGIHNVQCFVLLLIKLSLTKYNNKGVESFGSLIRQTQRVASGELEVQTFGLRAERASRTCTYHIVRRLRYTPNGRAVFSTIHIPLRRICTNNLTQNGTG